MSTSFPRPLSVLVGLGFPRRIARLDEAVIFLGEQAHDVRDEAYEATVDTCRAALAGAVAPQEASDVFSAFARRRGILIEGPFSDVPAKDAGRQAAALPN